MANRYMNADSVLALSVPNAERSKSSLHLLHEASKMPLTGLILHGMN